MNVIALFITFFFLFCECNYRKILLNLSKVTLKVYGKGSIKILSDNFFNRYKYCEIYFNDSIINITKNELYFDSNYSLYIDNITILWNITISSIDKMFQNCDKIIEIDLSKFDTSGVTNTKYMFQNCFSLISINLSYFDTTMVNNMASMFYRCFSLTSLDLSNFNTSTVTKMDSMFYCIYGILK